jgi:uncharacterized protein YdaU (DUF1376 family)
LDEALNYYEHHLGDYLRDTAHLSMIEDGAYRRLLDAYYIRETPLPQKISDVMRLVRAQNKSDRDATETVLREFFTETPDGWTHSRCEQEISRFQGKRIKAKASAEARWDACERNANAMRTHSERNANGMPRARVPDTSHQSPDTIEEINQLSLVPALPPDEAASDKASTKGIPDCPHQDVLALWAEMLPSLPQHLASQWRGSRADHLRARWRETATEKGWKDSKQGIEYFRKLFAYVGRSEFLTGRATQQGRRPFIVELEWLVSPSNWAKVHEGKYHGDAA